LIIAGSSGLNVDSANLSALPILIIIVTMLVLVIVFLSTIFELTVASEERCGSVDYDYD